MGTQIDIYSSNYSGKTADITFYPDTGGTIVFSGVSLPYIVDLDYYYGSYEVYFPMYGVTCYTYISNPLTNYLLQENFSTLDQEDNSKILIT